jgi:hypothetical protein
MITANPMVIRVRRLLFGMVIGGLLAGLGGCQATGTRDAADAAEVSGVDQPLFTMTEAQIDQHLAVMQQREPQLNERVISLARQAIGQPYEIYLLGEWPYEMHDPDPVYCLTKSDCLVFTEHMYAMALSADWWTFLQTLQRIRYRDGQIGMLTRNHYTVPEWNRHNAFFLEDVTENLGGGAVTVELRQVCRRARFFKQFGIGQDIPDEPIEDRYIPKDRLPEVLDELRNGDFVNIIRGNEDSQWCGHTGFVAIGEDGTVNFLHSARPRVREQSLVEYVNGDRRCLGVKFLRLRPDAEERMARALAEPQVTPVSAAAMTGAWAQRVAAWPPEARPVKLDWLAGSRLQALRLPAEAPVDPELQADLAAIDAELCTALEISPEQRAVGVLRLNDQKLAWIQPEAMFYAASVPKIIILAAYMDQQPLGAELPADVTRELELMIKRSDNALAAKYGELVGLEQLEEFVRSKRYHFYDEDAGGGFWVGKHYSKASPRVGDPLFDHSHGATVRQCLRYYLMLEQGRLVNAEASAQMRAIFAAPGVEHLDSKFVKGLAGRHVQISRKSGTWEDWHLDTARVTRDGGPVYVLVGMVHHPRGAEYLEGLARRVDDFMGGEIEGSRE